MELAILSANQVFIMFLLVSIGFICFKIKIIDDVGTAQMTDVLLKIVFPSVILAAFTVTPTEEKLKKFLIALVLTFISHILGIIVSYIFIRKKHDESNTEIERFSVIYTNNGFMGIPLIGTLLGEQGIFYATAFVCIGNLFTWTHGVGIMSNKSGRKLYISLLKIIKSPAIVAFIIGMILFISRVSLPQDINKLITFTSNMNTPLAMFIVGAVLAQTNIITAFKELKVYKIAVLANLLVPIIAVCIYAFLPIDNNLILNNIISTACPVSCLTVIFAKKYKMDIEYASKIFTVSNILTIITLPIVIFFSNMILA